MEKLLGMTPPMGWNSWNTFTWEINEELIKQAADAFIENGLKDAGYEYVVIDDCWSEKQRNEKGELVPDHWKFPNGIKPVADYVHSKGLKFGIYSCAGTHTCAGHPGSFEHEFQDAETFAEWGVDYLKYDYCYKPVHIPGEILYKRMSTALRNCGRPIMFSACNWGNDDIYKWIRESGAHLFRSTGDIQDNWESIKRLALSQMGNECYGGCFCHNDIDMLVVGMHGGSNNQYINGESDDQFGNKEVIAINQDIECRGPYRISQWNNPENVFSLVKPLANGDYAIGMYNFSDVPAEMSLQFWDIGLSTAAGRGLEMHDCWSHEDIGRFSERYVTTLQPHDCAVYTAKVVKL